MRPLLKPTTGRHNEALYALSRRAFGLGALGVLGVLRQPAWADVLKGNQLAAAAAAKYFSVRGGGGYGGDSWEDAMPIAWLAKALPFAEPGERLIIGKLAASDGAVPLGKISNTIQSAGKAGSPIQIVGDGSGGAAPAAAAAEFQTASPWSVIEGAKNRIRSFFVLDNGASDLEFSGFNIIGTSANGFFRFHGTKENPIKFGSVVIQNIDAQNVGRIIETDPGTLLDGLTVRNAKVTGIVRGFARFRNLTNATFKDLVLDAANMDGGGKNVCQIIAIEACDNVTFDNVVLKNAVNTIDAGLRDNGKGYVQGDGIVAEHATRNITIRNCQAIGMGDAGFDLKTTGVTIEDCQTDSCKYGVRIWAPADNVIRRSALRNPRSAGTTQGACLQAIGTTEAVDCKFQAGAGTMVFNLPSHGGDHMPTIKVTGGEIELAEGAALAKGTPGSILELQNVTVNGKARTERYVLDGSDIF